MGAFTDAEADRLVQNIEQAMQMATFCAAGSIGSKMVGVAIIVVGHDPDRPDGEESMSAYAQVRIGSRYGLRDSTITGAMAHELATLAVEQKGSEDNDSPGDAPQHHPV